MISNIIVLYDRGFWILIGRVLLFPPFDNMWFHTAIEDGIQAILVRAYTNVPISSASTMIDDDDDDSQLLPSGRNSMAFYRYMTFTTICRPSGARVQW